MQHGDFLCSRDVTDAEIKQAIRGVKIVYNNYKQGYYNMPCAFDIETTSFKKGVGDDAEKFACMYLWGCSLNGLCVYGRTWTEWINWCSRLHKLITRNNFRMVIYVHNLGYEFQFIRRYHNWLSVFAREPRKPMKALTDTGLEFRCSYRLSNYSLAKVADHLPGDVSKKVGDLDYRKMRHSGTDITEQELNYAYWDIKIIEMYIREEIERNEGNILQIPLTSTGYVRRLVKDSCYNYHSRLNQTNIYRDFMNDLILTMDEYNLCKRAYMGGFTHANAYYVNEIMDDVNSYDFASSYPAVMLAEKYPMSRGKKVVINSKAEFDSYRKNYCCIFDIGFRGLRNRMLNEQILSVSKCRGIKKPYQLNNGRVVHCAELFTSMTEVDFYSMEKFYEWDDISISTMYIYERDYLPTEIVTAILELYQKKTTLKDVEGMEAEYMHIKELLNSIYGMMVTDILSDTIIYEDDEWHTIKPTSEQLDNYNNKRTRTLFYPWGLYVTAYARRNLFDAINEIGNDYIYSDTDSIKIRNADKHKQFLDNYNNFILDKTEKALQRHKLPVEMAWPTDSKGNVRPIGVWEHDGAYKRFKTLGAKRYLVEFPNDKHKITIAGVSKKKGIEYLEKLARETGADIFDLFCNDLYFPSKYSGKNLLTYIDEPYREKLKDYAGKTLLCHEESYIHMEESAYSLSMSDEFINYLIGIRDDPELYV